MLHVAPGVKVYLACQPVDMRRGFDGLSAEVARILAADPYSGAAFVFRGKRGDYVKILTWDGSGLCLCQAAQIVGISRRISRRRRRQVRPDRRRRARCSG